MLGNDLGVQRRLTTAFISTAPQVVVLVPRAKVKQPGGGHKWQELAPRASQTMRFVEPPNPIDPIRTADGIEREVQFLLVAEHDAVIGVNDVFETADGHWWEVVQLMHFNGWERRAMVARHG